MEVTPWSPVAMSRADGVTALCHESAPTLGKENIALFELGWLTLRLVRLARMKRAMFCSLDTWGSVAVL